MRINFIRQITSFKFAIYLIGLMETYEVLGFDQILLQLVLLQQITELDLHT